MNKTTPWLLAAGVGLLLMLALAVAAVFAYQALQPPDPGDLAALRPVVQITSPSAGDQLAENELVLVTVDALGGTGFEAIELWINGVHQGTHRDLGPTQGGAEVTFAWHPAGVGFHILSARAADSRGGYSTSASVAVLVAAKPGVGEDDDRAASSPGLVLPVSDDVGGGPAGPSGDAQTAAPWSGNPLDQLGGQAEAVPVAPELAAELDGCAVQLSINDLSDNEDGFVVNRQALQAPAAVEVAALGDHDGSGWIETSDVPGAGSYAYTVTAFNDQGGSDSNPVPIAIDPADCPASEQAGQTMQLQLANLQLGPAVIDAYCYRSLNQGAWDRWPATGFFQPEEGGFLPAGETWEIFLGGDGEEIDESDLSLALQCWGWQAGHLQLIGEVEQGLGEQGPGQWALNDGAFSVELVKEIGQGRLGYIPIGTEFETLDIGPGSWGDWALFKLGMQMPRPIAFTTTSSETCTDHLTPEAQNLLGTILFCTPWPGYTTGIASDNPQHYLAWLPTGPCLGGLGAGPCKSYDQWLSEANKVGYTVTYWTDDVSDYKYSVSAPYHTVYVIKPLSCQTFRAFTVQMWAQVDAGTVYGPNSQPVSIPCVKPNKGIATVYVTFDNLRFEWIDDGESEPQDIEIYSVFKAWTSAETVEIWQARQSDWDGDCPSEAFSGTLNTSGVLGLGCRQSVGVVLGGHNLANFPMCIKPCNENWYAPGRNQIALAVPEGEPIHLLYSIMDYDSASANDSVCFHTGQTETHTYEEWQALEEDSFWMNSFASDSGDCQVRIILEGALSVSGN